MLYISDLNCFNNKGGTGGAIMMQRCIQLSQLKVKVKSQKVLFKVDINISHTNISSNELLKSTRITQTIHVMA